MWYRGKYEDMSKAFNINRVQLQIQDALAQIKPPDGIQQSPRQTIENVVQVFQDNTKFTDDLELTFINGDKTIIKNVNILDVIYNRAPWYVRFWAWVRGCGSGSMTFVLGEE
jgi:hypothetical protein